MGCNISTEETLDQNALANNNLIVDKQSSYDASRQLTENMLSEASCENFKFRLLENEDYSKGFLDVLGDLTFVNADEITQKAFSERLTRLHSDTYYIAVI